MKAITFEPSPLGKFKGLGTLLTRFLNVEILVLRDCGIVKVRQLCVLPCSVTPSPWSFCVVVFLLCPSCHCCVTRTRMHVQLDGVALPRLLRCDLTGNAIADMSAVLAFGAACPRVRYCDVRGNPVVTKSSWRVRGQPHAVVALLACVP